MNKLYLLLIVAIISGCTSVDFSAARSESIYSVIASPSEIRIYRSDKPEKPYQEIGLVHFKGSSNLNTAVGAMKKKASEKGGNAIIDLKIIPGGSIGTVIIVQ